MNIFGDAAALKGLKEGEEHGLKDYQAGVRSFHARYFLDRPHFDPKLKRIWRGQRWMAKQYFINIGLDE